MMYKNVLFDFDGTISNTSKGIVNAAKYALEKMNINYEGVDLNKFIGPPLQDSFKTFFKLNNEETLKAITTFREYYKETGLYESELYDGIREVIKSLYDHNCKLFIASTKPTVFIEKLLRKYDLMQYFEYISGSQLEGACYPKEIVISEIIKKYELIREQTIMIGDTKYDVKGAKENKISSMGVTYGIGNREELQEQNADYIANDVNEILKVIL